MDTYLSQPEFPKYFDLACRRCGGLHVILSGLDADTFHERIRLDDGGVTVSRGKSKRPLIRFKLFCIPCSAVTTITVAETDDRRVSFATCPVVEEA